MRIETIDRCHVLPGRHQPPHRDHLTVIHRALDATDEPLVIGLVVPTPSSPGGSGEPLHPAPIAAPGAGADESAAPCRFTEALRREAAAHHALDRNPYPYLMRRAMLLAALEESVPAAMLDRIVICPMPPPESSWPYIDALLPARRTWIVPDCGEALDDMKARFFRSRGEGVMRVPFAPTCNGGTVRRLVAEGDPRVATMVPPAVARMLLGRRPSAVSTLTPNPGGSHDLARTLH